MKRSSTKVLCGEPRTLRLPLNFSSKYFPPLFVPVSFWVWTRFYSWFHCFAAGIPLPAGRERVRGVSMRERAGVSQPGRGLRVRVSARLDRKKLRRQYVPSHFIHKRSKRKLEELYPAFSCRATSEKPIFSVAIKAFCSPLGRWPSPKQTSRNYYCRSRGER